MHPLFLLRFGRLIAPLPFIVLSPKLKLDAEPSPRRLALLLLIPFTCLLIFNLPLRSLDRRLCIVKLLNCYGSIHGYTYCCSPLMTAGD